MGSTGLCVRTRRNRAPREAERVSLNHTCRGPGLVPREAGTLSRVGACIASVAGTAHDADRPPLGAAPPHARQPVPQAFASTPGSS